MDEKDAAARHGWEGKAAHGRGVRNENRVRPQMNGHLTTVGTMSYDAEIYHSIHNQRTRNPRSMHNLRLSTSLQDVRL